MQREQRRARHAPPPAHALALHVVVIAVAAVALPWGSPLGLHGAAAMPSRATAAATATTPPARTATSEPALAASVPAQSGPLASPQSATAVVGAPSPQPPPTPVPRATELLVAAVAKRDAGDIAGAITLFRASIDADPTVHAAHYLLGTLLLQHDLYPDEALDRVVDSIVLSPDLASGPQSNALNNIGLRLYREAQAASASGTPEGAAEAASKIARSLAVLDKAVAADASSASARHNKGIVLEAQGHTDAAARLYESVIALQPDHAAALTNLGALRLADGLYLESAELFRRAAESGQDDAVNRNAGMFNMGQALKMAGQVEEAVEQLQRAAAMRTGDIEVQLSLATARRTICDWSALGGDAQARALWRLTALLWMRLGLPMPQHNRDGGAGDNSTVAEAPPDQLEIGSGGLAGQLQAALFLPYDALLLPMPAAWTRLVAEGMPALTQATAAPVQYLPSVGSQRRVGKLRVAYVGYDFREHAMGHLTLGILRHHDREAIEVACYHYGPDRAAPTTPPGAPTMTQVLGTACAGGVSRWHKRDTADLARHVRDTRTHVFVDLMGHTTAARLDVPAHRSAPITVNYLGYPGTTGVAATDYVIVDRGVSSAEERGHFSERRVYLPHTYQAKEFSGLDVAWCGDPGRGDGGGDSGGDGSLPGPPRRGPPRLPHAMRLPSVPPAPAASHTPGRGYASVDDDAVQHAARSHPCIAASRARHGLPTDPSVLVLGNFNIADKLEPTAFEMWMSLMTRVRHTVLWLMHPKSDAAVARLRAEAAARGVAPARLVFAHTLPRAQHTARYQLLDLFVDTHLYTSHSTASDALWAGVPLLTLASPSFQGRVATSLVRQAGVQHTVAYSQKDFVALGEGLLTRAGGRTLRRVAAKLASARPHSTVFDTRALVADLQRAYAAMWERRHAVLGGGGGSGDGGAMASAIAAAGAVDNATSLVPAAVAVDVATTQALARMRAARVSARPRTQRNTLGPAHGDRLGDAGRLLEAKHAALALHPASPEHEARRRTSHLVINPRAARDDVHPCVRSYALGVSPSSQLCPRRTTMHGSERLWRFGGDGDEADAAAAVLRRTTLLQRAEAAVAGGDMATAAEEVTRALRVTMHEQPQLVLADGDVDGDDAEAGDAGRSGDGGKGTPGAASKLAADPAALHVSGVVLHAAREFLPASETIALAVNLAQRRSAAGLPASPPVSASAVAAGDVALSALSSSTTTSSNSGSVAAHDVSTWWRNRAMLLEFAIATVQARVDTPSERPGDFWVLGHLLLHRGGEHDAQASQLALVRNLHRNAFASGGRHTRKAPRPAKHADPRPSLAIYCHEYGQAWWGQWGPWSVNTTGLGGSEEAVVFMVDELAKSGAFRSIEVYADPPPQHVGVWAANGVAWYPAAAFDTADGDVDVFVSWRYHLSTTLAVRAALRYVWLQDMVPFHEQFAAPYTASIDGIFAVSEFHAAQLPVHTGARAKAHVMRNALHPGQFVDGPNEATRLVYASAPKRGLELILTVWGSIRRRVPTATLVVYYGFTDSFVAHQKQALGAEAAAGWMAHMRNLLRQDGVQYVGLVNHADLAEGLAASGFAVYPTSFPETGCIAIQKAMAMGALPITSQLAGSVLPELTARWDLGPPPLPAGRVPDEDVEWQAAWADSVVAAMQAAARGDPAIAERRRRMVQWARAELTWGAVARRWIDVFEQDMAAKEAARGGVRAAS